MYPRASTSLMYKYPRFVHFVLPYFLVQTTPAFGLLEKINGSKMRKGRYRRRGRLPHRPSEVRLRGRQRLGVSLCLWILSKNKWRGMGKGRYRRRGRLLPRAEAVLFGGSQRLNRSSLWLSRKK